jgi:pyroglutamyl-peptidase
MSPASVLLVVVLIAVAVVLGASLGGRASEPRAAPVALVTAFEPFGGASVNASWEAVKALDGETIAGHRVAVALLPVVYDEMAAPLEAAVARHRPSVVVSFGLGRGVIHVERVARNGYASVRPKDNKGREPPRAEVVPAGRSQLPSGLPVDEILAALSRAGLSAEASDDAGGYLCNECFYRLMSLDSAAGKAIRARGFVHLPAIDAPNPAGGTYTIERLREAVRIVVERTARAASRP